MNTTQRILIAPIRFYRRFLSPLHPPCCRFYPTCSSYAIEAIQVHGPAKGLYLAARRILRCPPGHPGGYDPVPGLSENDHQTAQCANSQENHG